MPVSVIQLSNKTFEIFYIISNKKYLKELRYYCCNITVGVDVVQSSVVMCSGNS
jgi:hypothetical protein